LREEGKQGAVQNCSILNTARLAYKRDKVSVDFEEILCEKLFTLNV